MTNWTTRIEMVIMVIILPTILFALMFANPRSEGVLGYAGWVYWLIMIPTLPIGAEWICLADNNTTLLQYAKGKVHGVIPH